MIGGTGEAAVHCLGVKIASKNPLGNLVRELKCYKNAKKNVQQYLALAEPCQGKGAKSRNTPESRVVNSWGIELE